MLDLDFLNEKNIFFSAKRIKGTVSFLIFSTFEDFCHQKECIGMNSLCYT